ncbi:hypothetical protein [Bacillus sp. FJAT-42376]|uniref:hypothetical protein n=1 Tax=Bacillus sp. FJAT-42376 TaxID=2014076 RepID=UPI000F4DD585|nr:hypothetical protein [Bacillus sp. FJAT-42376]
MIHNLAGTPDYILSGDARYLAVPFFFLAVPAPFLAVAILNLSVPVYLSVGARYLAVPSPYLAIPAPFWLSPFLICPFQFICPLGHVIYPIRSSF